MISDLFSFQMLGSALKTRKVVVKKTTKPKAKKDAKKEGHKFTESEMNGKL